jgi:hypothetical protein
MSLSLSSADTQPRRSSSLHLPAVLFGACLGLFATVLLTYTIDVRSLNDFYREAWPAYRLLLHGRFLGFLRAGPPYIGSLLLRAPFALLAGLLGASARGVYVATAIPCAIAPGVLAGYLAGRARSEPAAAGTSRGVRPVDLFMLTPPAFLAISGGHPEDVLGGVLCVLSVLLACRGSSRAAGLTLALAVINKSWALVAVPLVLALMPEDRRLSGFVTLVVVAGAVMLPVTALRLDSAASLSGTLGDQTYSIFLPPQLLWWLGRSSWIVQQAHILLVLADWLVSGVWWWWRVHRPGPRPPVRAALAALALVLFLRCALDPWDNFYYMAPFMLAVAVMEDPPGFPAATWLIVLTTLVVVPPHGLLRSLGPTAEAAAFALFALPTIAWLGRLAFAAGKPLPPAGYAASDRSLAPPAANSARASATLRACWSAACSRACSWRVPPRRSTYQG